MRTNLQNPIYLNTNAPASGRSSARTDRSASEPFSTSLAAATRSTVRLSSGTSPLSGMSGAVSSNLQAATSVRETTKSSDQATRSAEASKKQVVTPFGTYELPSESDQPVERSIPLEGWRAYFYTHQPGDWDLIPEMRDLFAQTYGDKALVTLDYTGTVPENSDPNWVTQVPLDASGKPFPKVWNL